MKKKIFFIVLFAFLLITLTSCSYIEDNMKYITGPEDVVNTVYTASIVGMVVLVGILYWGEESN